MAVGKAQVTGGWMRLQQAAVCRLRIGPGHQAYRPRLRALFQHLRNRPVFALASGIGDTQRYRLHAARQFDVGTRRQQRTAWQDFIAGQGQVCSQRHAFGPGHAIEAGSAAQQRASFQDGASGERLVLAQQRAGGKQKRAGCIVDIRRQHRPGLKLQGLSELCRDRQAGSLRQRQGIGLHIEIQRDTGGELRASCQGHAAARHHHRAAGVVNAGTQYPAIVIVSLSWRCKAVIDAAVDIQVATGAQGQAAGFGQLRRFEAGIAVAGQVQVALHHQVAVRSLADDFHPRTHVEHVAVGRVVQAGEFVLQQVVVAQDRLDELGTQLMLFVQIGLVDRLVGAPAGCVVGFGGGIVVADHAVEGDGACTLDRQLPAGVNRDVIAGAVRVDNPRGVQLQGATVAPVIAGGVGAVAQVDTRAVGQGQLAVAGAQHHNGAVGRVNDLAIAVHPQLRAVGIEYCAAIQGQAVLGRQVDIADPLAAGVHPSGHPQAAVVHRHIDGVGLDVIADDQVALLELEATRTVHLATVETLVERRELLGEGTAGAQALGLDLHRARQVRHTRAASIVVTAAAGDDLARQVDDPRRAIDRHGAQLARLVVLRRQVDARTGRLQHIARAAFQQHFAAGAVFGQVVKGNGTAGHIDQ